jgi:tRNA (guanine37-N1)-methyltransferase
MFALKVNLSDAEKARDALSKAKIMDYNYGMESDRINAFIPLRSKDLPDLNLQYKIVERDFKSAKRPKRLVENLDGLLSAEELNLVRRSYDIVGDIAIIEVPEGLDGKEKVIAKAIMGINSNIKTVLKKSDIHQGEFRTQKLKYVAGKRTKETVHKENNVMLKLDVEKVYFSPRLSTERKRVMEIVVPSENVLVMFSGCGPYPMVIAKNTKADHIVGIEKNEVAHKYALENSVLNKVKNVDFILGDVRDIVPKLRERYDRIIMPLPKDADTFLDMAFMVSKPGTIVHLYLFLDKDDLDEGKRKVSEACKRYGKMSKILNVVKCGQYSPSTFRVCVDFKILN